MTVRTRSFGRSGLYRFQQFTRLKSEANRAVRLWRERGNSARITLVKDGYIVWIK